jgi:predicted amidohydrolase YtcJ
MAIFRYLPALAIASLISSMACAQSDHYVITDVTIIDGTGVAARPHMTVVIDKGRIIAIDSGTSDLVTLGLHIIAGRDKFLIPGLWDMHVHVSKAGAASLGLFIANGVTSVRDMGAISQPFSSGAQKLMPARALGPVFPQQAPSWKTRPAWSE